MFRPSHSWFALLFTTLALWFCPAPAEASHLFRRVPSLHGRFQGEVLDFTNNHGCDRRLWSNALGEKRDLYVYLPPGYDPAKKYPFIFWLHGIEQDEKGFLEHGLPQVDQAMGCGKLAPAIIAIPDGSIRGRPGYFSANSGFLKSRAGDFETYLFEDVHDFMRRSFPLRSERQAHVLAGVSIGGGAAFRHGITRRKHFGVVAAIFPPSTCAGQARTDTMAPNSTTSGGAGARATTWGLPPSQNSTAASSRYRGDAWCISATATANRWSPR